MVAVVKDGKIAKKAMDMSHSFKRIRARIEVYLPPLRIVFLAINNRKTEEN